MSGTGYDQCHSEQQHPLVQEKKQAIRLPPHDSNNSNYGGVTSCDFRTRDDRHVNLVHQQGNTSRTSIVSPIDPLPCLSSLLTITCLKKLVLDKAYCQSEVCFSSFFSAYCFVLHSLHFRHQSFPL